MPAYLCLSITFHHEMFHGRRDGGEPEWPPSPLRLFQSLVAASAAAMRAGGITDDPTAALTWLERLDGPCIVAPPHQVGSPIRVAVPNNDLDVIAAAWAKGQESKKQPSELKTLKTVRPTHIHGRMVHYVYPLAAATPGCAEMLCAVARNVTHVGWGVDMVAGHGRILGQDEVDDLQRQPGNEVWRPCADPTASTLRVPIAGSLEALDRRHGAFLGRLGNDGYRPVPPLTTFGVRGYRRSTDTTARPFAAFEIWKPIRELADLPASGTKARPFDPVRSAVVVAAMVRAATARAAGADNWPEERIATYVHGHASGGDGPARGPEADQRLAFLPLPSITHLKVDAIRRVLVVAPPGNESEAAWLREALAGQQLINEQRQQPAATLSTLSAGDRNLRPYLDPAEVWSTVTPVVMPGRFINGAGRIMRLLRGAFAQAGWPEELFRRAEFEWRDVGFRAGVDVARRFAVPQELNHLAKLHIRVRWPVPVRGPLAIGSGRYRGLGVFASEGG